MADVYGTHIPSAIPNPVGYAGEPVPAPGLPYEYPFYLKPIPINTRNVQALMEAQLDKHQPRLVQWLYSTWQAQGQALKYQEIRNAIRDGEFTQAWLDQWQQDYSQFVVDVLAPRWRQIATSSAQVMGEDMGVFKPGAVLPFQQFARRMEAWVDQRGADLVVDVTASQTQAMREIVRHFTYDHPVGPKTAARYIRPTVGLTPKQARAVLRMRESLAAEGLAANVIEHRVQNYAHYLQRLRAERIARTEISFATNHGQVDAIRAFVDDGTLAQDKVVKKFATCFDERVCALCGEMDGKTVGLEDTFPGGTSKLPNLYVPPLHPNCRCTIMYEVLEPTTPAEVSAPTPAATPTKPAALEPTPRPPAGPPVRIPSEALAPELPEQPAPFVRPEITRIPSEALGPMIPEPGELPALVSPERVLPAIPVGTPASQAPALADVIQDLVEAPAAVVLPEAVIGVVQPVAAVEVPAVVRPRKPRKPRAPARAPRQPSGPAWAAIERDPGFTGTTGTAVRRDGLNVENQEVRWRREILLDDRGRPSERTYARLRLTRGTRAVEHAEIILRELGAQEQRHAYTSADVLAGRVDKTGRGGQFGGKTAPYGYRALVLETDDYKITLAVDRVNTATFGNLELEFKTVDTQRAYESFLELCNTLGVSGIDKAPSADDVQTWIRYRILRQWGHGESFYTQRITKQRVNSLFEELVAAKGQIIRDIEADARIQEVAPGHWAPYSQSLADLAKKQGVEYLYHDLGSPDHIPLMLSDRRGTGVLSSSLRWERGLFIDGQSTGTDFTTGGADGAFFRVKLTETETYKTARGRVVLDPRDMGRMDWWAHDHDGWGDARQHGDYGNYRERVKPDTVADRMGGHNEIMFQGTNDVRNYWGIVVESRRRDEIIAACRNAGITHVPRHSGRPIPIDQFIVDNVDNLRRPGQ